MTTIDENVAKKSSVSSGFVRVVGDVTIEVVNTSQRDSDVTKAAAKFKWAVMTFKGKKKSLVSGHARKYDAIAALRAHEHKLRSA
tara:strand:- start:9 stop:263 length:255 start_codon:yes stop_codon:yes gene_type:complete